MAESLGDAVLDLRTDNKRFDSDIDRSKGKAQELESRFKSTERTLKSLGGSLQKSGKSLSLFVTAPLVGLGALSVKLADVQIQAERGLEAALQFAGAPAEALPDLKEFARELQGITTVGDETTLKLLQVASSMGLSSSQSKTAAKEAIGLSKAFGISETTAIRYTAALAEGDTTMLNRYIPTLRQVEDDAERVALAHELLGGAFSVATAEAEEGLGPWRQLGNQFGDLQEDFGRLILQSIEPLVGMLSDLIGWVQGLDDTTKQWIVTIGAIAAAVGPVLVVLGTLLSAIGSIAGALAPGGALITGGSAVVAMLTGPVGIALAIGAVAAAITSFIAREGGMLENWFAETTESIADIRGSLTDNVEGVNALADSFRSQFPAITAEISKGVAAGESYADMTERLKGEFAAGTAEGDALREKLSELEAAERAAAAAAQDELAPGVDAVTTAAAGAAPPVSKLEETLSQLGFTTAVQAEQQIDRLAMAVGSGVVPVEQSVAKYNELRQRYEALGILTPEIEAKLEAITAELLEQGAALDADNGALLTYQQRLAAIQQERVQEWADGWTISQEEVNEALAGTKEEADTVFLGPDGLPSTVPATTGALEDMFGSIETGIPLFDDLISKGLGFLDSLLGGIPLVGDLFGKLFGSGGTVGSLAQQLFGGGSGSLGGIIGSALGGPLGSIVGNFATDLAGKLFGGVKDLLGGIFGGPDAAELEARETANALDSVFRDLVDSGTAAAEGLTETWQFNNAAQRDIILAMGGSVADVEATWTRFKDAATDPAIAAEYDAFWSERIATVQGVMESTGLSLTEIRNRAINESQRLGVSVAEAFQMIADGTIDLANTTAASAQVPITAMNRAMHRTSTRIEERVKAMGLSSEREAKRIERANERATARIEERFNAAGETVERIAQEMAASSSSSAAESEAAWVRSATETARAWEATRTSTIGASSITDIAQVGVSVAGDLEEGQVNAALSTGDVWDDEGDRIQRAMRRLGFGGEVGASTSGVDPSPAVLQPGSAAGGRGAGTIVLQLDLDGETVTRKVIRLTPGMLRQLGLS